MTAEEYFAIALPTPEDFKKWTKSFFARVDNAIKNAERHLSETTKEGIRMTVKRNGALVVDTDNCPKCGCSNCNHKCYEREAMDLHTREIGFEYMRTLDINND